MIMPHYFPFPTPFVLTALKLVTPQFLLLLETCPYRLPHGGAAAELSHLQKKGWDLGWCAHWGAFLFLHTPTIFKSQHALCVQELGNVLHLLDRQAVARLKGPGGGQFCP